MFLDTKRLKDGRNFRDDFAVAIVNTTVIVPVISNYALERMQKLTDSSDADNLLIEWSLAAILGDLSSVGAANVRVYPIMLGPIDTTTTTALAEVKRLAFQSNDIQTLPEVLPTKTLHVVVSILDRLRILEDVMSRLPYDFTTTLTVREVVKKLSLFQAYRPRNETQASIVATACDDKVNLDIIDELISR